MQCYDSLRKTTVVEVKGVAMANIVSVASYILDCLGSSSTMKLQKLVYYSHAYHLVNNGEPLFPDRFEAWANGPVAPSLFDKHRHQFVISAGYFEGYGEFPCLTKSEINSINTVLAALGDLTGVALSNLTHSEDPWKNARAGLKPTERSSTEITQQAIKDYYSSSRCTNPAFA